MRRWFRGKRGGLVGFLAVAALVAGGLGWATAAVLRLEQEQRQDRAQMDLVGKLRLALWQLDSFVLPDLAREDNRPFRHYSQPPDPTANRDNEPALGGAGLPDWVLVHFQCDDRGWKSPELIKLPAATRKAVSAKSPSPEVTRKREQVLEGLKAHWDSRSLLALVDERGHQPLVTDTALVQANPDNRAVAQSPNNDYDKRLNYQQRIKQEANSAPSPELVTVSLSRPMVPRWLPAEGEQERLVILRRVQIGTRQMCQGVVLDWPRLREALAEQVKDLFPQARFVPLRDRTPPRPERTMTALPVELDPGPAAGVAPVPGWTPVRIGLAVAWAAVLVALASVALGGWSLLDLSERRSRFVSAVTHELRTPLTTLRLYLDMLTSGMVREEAQKAEYLHTLHAEADRLNRLVANVLDFARLENQVPRLEKTRVAVADLLAQVGSTWQARCHDAGKELVLESLTAADAALVTDGQLVQQVVGNLIDNACKYTQTAADRRIWVRARAEGGRLVLEVEDRGPGIPAGERRSIFSPFRRGRNSDAIAGGVGLGLALARRWARLLGGELNLRWDKGEPGACFRLALPFPAE
jgi:signal transduction histidine kinase